MATEGKTVDGSAVPSINGMPKDYMVLQMKAFKDGTRPCYGDAPTHQRLNRRANREHCYLLRQQQALNNKKISRRFA
jgi:hypothetical protein